jgi:hypothetical protein
MSSLTCRNGNSVTVNGKTVVFAAPLYTRHSTELTFLTGLGARCILPFLDDGSGTMNDGLLFDFLVVELDHKEPCSPTVPSAPRLDRWLIDLALRRGIPILNVRDVTSAAVSSSSTQDGQPAAHDSLTLAERDRLQVLCDEDPRLVDCGVPLKVLASTNPVIILQDLTGKCETEWKEFRCDAQGRSTAPTLYYDSLPGSCPFVPPSSATQNTTLKYRALKPRRKYCEICKGYFTNSMTEVLDWLFLFFSFLFFFSRLC